MALLSLKAHELRLGDVLLLESINAYHTATVKGIEPQADRHKPRLTMFRPYVAHPEFTMGKSVICYVGIEEWAFVPHDDERFLVLERKTFRLDESQKI